MNVRSGKGKPAFTKHSARDFYFSSNPLSILFWLGIYGDDSRQNR